MATSTEQLGEHSTTEASQPLEMVNVDIAAEGDVIFVLQQARLRVSSVILSSASPVFKVMFGPNFAEGQGNRTAAEPREVPLHDDDLCAMTRLCRILHHQYEPADAPLTSTGPVESCVDDLFALTVVSDKYGCIESVQAVTKSLLSDLASASLSPLVSPMALLVLSAVAYKVSDCRHFALFTRRLVLDVTSNYSSLAGHALEALPNTFLVLVEEQRNASRMAFREMLPKLADLKCASANCGVMSTSFKLPAAVIGWNRTLGSADAHWPLDNKTTCLRAILKTTHNRGNVVVRLDRGCPHTLLPDQHTVTGDTLRRLCHIVNKIACGICLTCLGEQSTVDGHCKHRASLESWIENDSLLQ